MEKKTASIIGIILGIAIFIIGLCVQGISVDATGHESNGTPSIGSYIQFGADFYTEMYAVTQDVGQAVNAANTNIHGAVNAAQRNICNAVESVCDAIGWLIVAIGAFDVAYFIYKLVSDEEDGYTQPIIVNPAVAPSTAKQQITKETVSSDAENESTEKPTKRPEAIRCPFCGKSQFSGAAVCFNCKRPLH